MEKQKSCPETLIVRIKDGKSVSNLCVCVGESVDDCGGGYSESIAEMCEELQNGLTPLLIVTPNGRDESGANRDCFLLNPAAKSPLHMSMFRFLGTHTQVCLL